MTSPRHLAATAALALMMVSSCRRLPDRLARLESRVDSLAVIVTVMNTVLQGGAHAARATFRAETATVDARHGAAMGEAAAPVTIVEFTDFQCPFCSQHNHTTLPLLKRQYIDRGLVRYVVRNNPLSIHPFAWRAAIAAQCAAAQGSTNYWQYHDAIFAAQSALADSSFELMARHVGLTSARFERCRGDKTIATSIDEDMAAAAQAGFQGTPTFVIGRTRPDGMLRGLAIPGAYPFAVFKAAIDSILTSRLKTGLARSGGS